MLYNGVKMALKKFLNPILYGIALAMGIAIFILSFFMSFTCAVNLRYFIVFLAIAILCVTIAGINSSKKE